MEPLGRNEALQVYNLFCRVVKFQQARLLNTINVVFNVVNDVLSVLPNSNACLMNYSVLSSAVATAFSKICTQTIWIKQLWICLYWYRYCILSNGALNSFFKLLTLGVSASCLIADLMSFFRLLCLAASS